MDNLKNQINTLKEFLVYPDENSVKKMKKSLGLLNNFSSGAKEQIEMFIKFLNSETLAQVEEIYTSTFDLGPVCYPYIGYQLFGEDYRRGEFLSKLMDEFKGRNFHVKGELPDHLSILLGFILEFPYDQFTIELVIYALIPALQKMLNSFSQTNPYFCVLKALEITMNAFYNKNQRAINS